MMINLEETAIKAVITQKVIFDDWTASCLVIEKWCHYRQWHHCQQLQPYLVTMASVAVIRTPAECCCYYFHRSRCCERAHNSSVPSVKRLYCRQNYPQYHGLSFDSPSRLRKNSCRHPWMRSWIPLHCQPHCCLLWSHCHHLTEWSENKKTKLTEQCASILVPLRALLLVTNLSSRRHRQ